MPRQPRFDYIGAFHHIMNRGYHGNIIFKSDDDFNYYLNCIENVKRFNFKIISYCIMSNHTHLLIQSGPVHLSRVMKSINSRFASWWMYKHQKRGPIFQGRFKSILVENTKYIKLLSRYIHRNPLKANLCTTLGKYKWSSYKIMSQRYRPEWYDDTVLLTQKMQLNLLIVVLS